MAVVRVTTAKIEPADTAQTSIATNSFVATAGNLIVVFIRRGSAGAITSVTDTAGNTYEEAVSTPDQDPRVFAYYAKNISGHASNVVTVNFSPSGTFTWAYAVQYSGLHLSAPLDVTEVKTGTGVTDLVSDPFTTTSPGVVVLGVTQANYTTYTAGTDFTLVDGGIGDNLGNNFGGVEERITSGALSSYTAHITSGVTNNYALAVVAFKTPADAGSPLFRGRNFPFFDDEEVNRFEFWPAVTVSGDVTLALTGVSSSAAVGTLGVAPTLALLGVQSNASVGNLSSQTSISISGNATTCSAGSLIVERTNAISSAAATGSVSTVSPSTTIGLIGVQATGDVGSVGTSVPGSAALTSVQLTAGIGNVDPNISIVLSGVASSIIVGSVFTSQQATLTGIQTTGAVGTLVPQISTSISGVASTATVGNVTGGAGSAAVVIKGPLNVSLNNSGKLAMTNSLGKTSVLVSSGKTSVDDL